MKDLDTEKIEQMILNNFSNNEMKAFIDNIISCKDKEKIKKNVWSGDIIEKYKKQSGVALSVEEEEIIKTIYLYLCIEGNAEKMKKLMEKKIQVQKAPFAIGSEKLTFLQWKDKKQQPKLFG